ncbi:hypothetical protein AKO1_005479 [Acrasis kona]|uniref:BLOC-1-related complex subunit 6 C-terminal helix domain-containing protein n=1 Tax=Acrasis kona TaxID=1008807 RepID=A0AAW2ZJ89_9EUKA
MEPETETVQETTTVEDTEFNTSTDEATVPTKEMVQILEEKSKELTATFLNLTKEFQNSMNNKTSVIIQKEEIYKQCIEETTQSVTQNIQAMNTFIERCEEINNKLREVRVVYNQVKNLRKGVEHLETLVINIPLK